MTNPPRIVRAPRTIYDDGRRTLFVELDRIPSLLEASDMFASEFAHLVGRFERFEFWGPDVSATN